MEESPPESPIPEQDVRAIVHLLGEVIAVPGGIDEKRRMLLDGLCGLISATSWVWCEVRRPPDQPSVLIQLAHGGSDDESLVPMPSGPGRAEEPGIHGSTVGEFRSYPADSTYNSAPVGEDHGLAPMLWDHGRTGAIVTSTRLIGSDRLSAIALVRKVGDRPFDERENRIARIILTSIPWLHLEAFPDPLGRVTTALYPRHRVVLDLLSRGWNRKRIAGHLGVSINTVHGYVKAVFKHFDVHSQAELISRLTKGLAGSDET